MTMLHLHLVTDKPVRLSVAKTLNFRSLLRRPDLLEDTFDEMRNSLARARRVWNKSKKGRQVV